MQAASTNIVHQGKSSESANRVAVLRAAHQLLDDPIVFKDEIALPILGKELCERVRENPFQYNDPMPRGLRAALVARSRFAEDRLADAVHAGVRQYVVLGAGLDTFAYRNCHAELGLQVFEVDHPSTQLRKKKALVEAGIEIPPGTHFIAHDFEALALADALQRGGFCPDQPAYFSWLGLTVYLTQDAIFETLGFVASLAKGSAVCFDYKIPDSRLQLIERMIAEQIRQIVAGMGEPWKSEFEPETLREQLIHMGFKEVEDVGASELNARYFDRRKDGLRTGEGFRLMHASV